MLNIETTRPEISLGGKLVLRFINTEREGCVSPWGDVSQLFCIKGFSLVLAEAHTGRVVWSEKPDILFYKLIRA